MKRQITVDLTNVSHEDQEELRKYLDRCYWAWSEETKEAD